MIPVTVDQVRRLAPHAKGLYLEAFANADDVLSRYGVNENGRRVAHFMAQTLHETGGLTILVENLNYSAERLTKVWPARFPTVEKAAPFARNPEKLAERVYGGRMGNIHPGDGWRYIGRGFKQLTGRANYARFGDILGIDLVGNPDLAIDPRYSLEIAAAFWRERGCSDAADRDDLRAVTLAVNGGLIGFAERNAWLLKARSIW
jgi:putative chitinase